jgi:hypothetical protein
MYYEYQEKKEGAHKLKYIVFEIYILSNGFHKIFFVCEYESNVGASWASKIK